MARTSPIPVRAPIRAASLTSRSASPAGLSAFQKVTATIAHRGILVSVAGATYDQHFAVAVDNHLLTVPSIDFKQYPDGIIGGGGAEITGGFTAHTAADLAVTLRFGPLPVSLAVH